MYKLSIVNILNQATNYVISGELAKSLLSLSTSMPQVKDIYTLEGPIDNEVNKLTETKIVVYDWQGFFNRVVAKQEHQVGYNTFHKIVSDLQNAA